MNKITKEQEDFLNKCTNGTWELNQETGSVDIDGNFDCSSMGLSDFLGIEFGDIRLNFKCSQNKLVSLKGAPKKVMHNFYCGSNKLVSLEGAPQKVGQVFSCSNNQLTSLEGGPKGVGMDFFCYANQLVSLEGAPQKVCGDFYCYRNPLVSLKVSNLQIGGYLFCDPVALKGCSPDLLRKIHFYTNMSANYIRLINDIGVINDIEGIINDLEPEIYLKKMI